MTPELSRLVSTDRIGAAGREVAIAAGADELAPVARRLQVVAVEVLTAGVRLRRIAEGVFEATGTVSATLVETCVVSLDPFSHAVAEPFVVRFVPAGAEADWQDPEDVDEVPYEGSAIDLGELVVEQLALSLDPYPRKPGAELVTDPEVVAGGAFAGLARLRVKGS